MSVYMTNEDWKYKIINASPTRLVIVTYEIILDRIRTAEKALCENDMDKFRASITNAKEFVAEMAASLDMSAPVSTDMADLYFFVNKLLTKAYFSQDRKFLADAAGIVEKLMRCLKKHVDDGIATAELSGSYTSIYGACGRRYGSY